MLLLYTVKALKLYRFAPEITMPKVNLSGMTVEALMELRKRVDERLLEHRAEFEKQLERMDAVAGGTRVVGGGGSVLRGRKVPPKYRGPSGETWAGRRKTCLACCCDQGWKEDRRFSNRQVSTKGTEKTQVEAMTILQSAIHPTLLWSDLA